MQAIGKYRWTICGLLFFATTVNYLDRQVLSLLAPELTDKFGWTNTDYGNITAVFQFVYALSMLFVGRIIDKMGTKAGYTWAIIIWSLGAILHALAVQIGEGLHLLGFTAVSASVIGFMIARAVLGFGEAGNFPAAIKATAEYFPKKERSFATGIFNSGANVGAILAPLTVPFIAAKWGWEMAFIVIGAIGFLWIIFWFIYYDKPEKQKRLSAAELAYIRSDDDEKAEQTTEEDTSSKVKWFKLLGYNQTWAFTIGKFLTDGVWWFFLFWLPKYLDVQYGLTGTQIALPLFVLYSLTMFGSIGGGWFPMYFIKKGYAAYDGRMKAMLMIAVIPLVVLLAQPLGSYTYWLPVLLIGIGASAHQAWSANIFTTVSDMFPKKAVASVVGIGGMAGGLGGVIVSKVGGALFDHFDKLGHIETGYTIMFAFCALAYLLAWIIMKSLVPKYKPITDL
ncbi:Hexuronate transporter [Mycovorax composti]|jgi:Sugar phosphate permease|uniref:Hexuronate transporter n=2 Tax=Chitinophagaceae TaxID=563835 RepID=A0ABZ2EJS6_9BACT